MKYNNKDIYKINIGCCWWDTEHSDAVQFPESSLQLPDLSDSVGVLDINDTKVVHTRLCFRFDRRS
jgi:hypothetical protein